MNQTIQKDILQWKAILESCRKNERQAQEKLYRHFFPIMERMVLRHTQDEDQIIDILNDGFLRVFQKIEKYEFKGSLEGWIRKIMYHSISNYFRKYKNDLKFLIYEEKDKEVSPESEHSLYYQDLLKLVDTLPEKHMKVFHLYAIEGYEHSEISKRLEMNPNTCRWYLAQARKLLQEAYNKKYLKNYNEAG
ncbi:MAG: sigma-70 family RNA polymerase sigma factor [Saprospiraceae bacterium]|nr:sigma-70 family RNA polymerase sigma factor [Bacteroidia bacterium]MBT8229564.1 sigma-70 family RNA polymerase sigma factor [Bacteroidia bacterium]NNF21039.1 sigma-70 family RNA polymerase sigma factor [Saprospiraceae bacterium]